jgi:dihydropteroate synthase
VNADIVSSPRPFGARVLVLDSPNDIAGEMARVGVEPQTVAFRLDKARLRVVKLEAIPREAAIALKQALESFGADTAISSRARRGAQASADCLLMATLDQYRRLCETAGAPANALAPVCAEINRALRAFDNRLTTELRCGAQSIRIGERTLVMGIINATPDSFSGDGLAGDVGAMVERGEQMAAEGADIIDVGGESTRPGSEPVDLPTEMTRVLPVIEGIRSRVRIPISIDTYKAEVARAALDAGASIVNDISGLRADPRMAGLAAARTAPVIVMHILGTPRTMQDNPQYDDLMGEIAAYLRESVGIAERAGVRQDQVVIDPGFGFGKTVEHNLEIVRRLRELRSLGQPVLLGPSRKSTIGKVLDLPLEERLEGTLAIIALAIANGADMVRVHDVRPAVRAARMAEAVVRGWAEG